MKGSKSTHIIRSVIPVLLVLMLLAACSPAPTAAPVAVPTALPEKPTEAPTVAPTVAPTAMPEAPTAIPAMQPGIPGPLERTLKDTNSSYSASAKSATTGDNILDNLYERPFSQDMTYQPDVDILTVDIASDTNFFYFTITLDGADPTSKTLTATYGIEFDRSKTGRGDLLVWAHDAPKNWSYSNMTVYTDPDGDVGGPKPILADANVKGDGYESKQKFSIDQIAYARISPDNPAAIQIAVSRQLLGNPTEFLWGAWADNGVKNPALFDYDDHFGPGQAGSPIKGSDYPLKALYSLDNTCRLPYGFTPPTKIPGMCISAPPQQKGSKCVCPYCPPTQACSCTC
jgi:hypothetical protein